jgi:7-cyano-7-deazaguanine synthase in queuosine biosynthesis
MAKDLAIVLNNGSLNSAVTTALAAQRHRVVMLMADTGEKTTRATRAAFDGQVALIKPFRDHVLPMPMWSDFSPTDESAAVATDPRRQTPVTPRLVDLLPLIATAARMAVHYQATSIHLGLRVGPAGDALAVVTEYGQIWNELLQTPCGQADTMIEMPLLELEPWQVVDVGAQASAPFDKTWTCTEPGPDPCWACRACRAREAAFQQAAKADPLRVTRKV